MCLSHRKQEALLKLFLQLSEHHRPHMLNQQTAVKMDTFLSLLCPLLIFGGCSARVVTVSPGPLIRVEGQPVSIRCDVIEYGGPREQDFEWMMSRDPTGPKTKIISTFDAGYSHPSLSKRVASGDISVLRLQDNEAELKIAEVKPMDAGFYWCQTPSTDSVISGNYEAQVQLSVIPNTLSVAPQTPPPVVSEGGDLILTCNVTRNLTQPTYLAITWSVKKGETSKNILTFGPDLSVVAAPQLTKRFMDGGARMVPGKDGVLDLVISKVTKSDEGVYECTGAEWTYEASEWVKIVESTKEMGPVAVTSVESFIWIQIIRGGLCLLLVVSFIIIFIYYRARVKTRRTSETNTEGRTDCSEL